MDDFLDSIGSSINSGISWFGGVAGDVLGVVSSVGTALNPNEQAANQINSTGLAGGNYLPWVIGGAVVVVALVILTRK